MEKSKINIIQWLGALILTMLEVQIIDSIGWLNQVIAFIPDTYISLIEKPSFVAVWAFNAKVLQWGQKGFSALCGKFPLLLKCADRIKGSKLTPWIGIVLTVVALSFPLSFISSKYKETDHTLPTVVATRPENWVIKAKQYEVPLVYHFYFDDESGIQKVFFNEDYLIMDGFTADTTISEAEENHYVLSLCNIDGKTGEYRIKIKPGAVVDVGANISKELTLGSFYLYWDESEVDLTAPEISVTPLETADISTMVFEVQFFDDRALASTSLLPKHIILVGFQADVEVTGTLTRTITLSNIREYSNEEPCKIIIAAGVAEDEWGNKSNYYVSQGFYI